MTTAFSVALMTAFFGPIIFFQWLAYAVALAFFVGLGMYVCMYVMFIFYCTSSNMDEKLDSMFVCMLESMC